MNRNFFISEMFSVLQSISLLDVLNRRSQKPLCWSKFDDVVGIIVKSGIYILTINPVPVNLTPALNTSPIFLANTEPDEVVCEIEWLPTRKILMLTTKGVLIIKDPFLHQNRV